MAKVTVGDAIVRLLEAHHVKNMYGVISIHNLPIADAVGRREQIHFVCARGEAGALSMADAEARFAGLGVVLTSTGAGAGNAGGSLVEAYNASSPVLHITGQVEAEYLDRDVGFTHEAKDQLSFLRAASKAAYRIMSPEHAVGVLREAIRVATTVPMGPVSVEIPSDVQAAEIELPADLTPVAPMKVPMADAAEVSALAQALKIARRPMLWVGGGALGATNEIKALADLGIPVVSSAHGRGILADEHPRSLGAFHNAEQVEQLIAEADVLVVVGSRLRSNETKTYGLQLSDHVIQIDASPMAQQRNYLVDQFVCGDSQDILSRVVAQLDDHQWLDADYDQRVLDAKQAAVDALSEQLGVYAELCFALREAMPEDGILVRDITMSGSTWGSRLFPVQKPLQNIHSLAGAIGLGLAHSIGAAAANPDKKVVALVGDGGLMLGLGEIATLVQENSNVIVLVMNDGGYGIMRGIQRRYFDDRQYFNQLHTPSYEQIGKAMQCASFLVRSIDEFKTVIAEAVAIDGPAVVEVDMPALGPFPAVGTGHPRDGW